ncbi:MAG: DUF72 domain-containing protein [Actinobacteria bacterium]|nr:MAG: DUF72 domain-containing protein [Actinomycetota bacterium]REK35745.1 MAG: DUF72 domain-containing protein [Actinomycetota bacterium]
MVTRIGVSGWAYDGWRGDFYPRELPRKDELSFISSHFDTVEVNGTFHSLLQPPTFREWGERTPTSFLFSIKGSRFITHNKKLANLGSALANFLASGVLDLGERLGPILWQVSENLHFDEERIDRFLGGLPKDTTSAAELARHHDERVEEVSYGPGENHRLRHVLELRHESWLREETALIAKRHGVTLAFSHSSEWPYFEQITAGFVYVRLHGPGRLYSSPYGRDQLRTWAERIQLWGDADEPADASRFADVEPPQRKGRDVYVYFDNDEGGHAPRDAKVLHEMVRG